jgi:hypothetical protein
VSEEAGLLDCCFCHVGKALRALADARYSKLTDKLVWQMRRIPANGLYEARKHNTLWDEYCHHVQHGPHGISQSAWEQSVGALAFALAEELPPEEARILTISALWHFDEEDSATFGKDGVSICRSSISRRLESLLSDRAGSRDMSRFDLW